MEWHQGPWEELLARQSDALGDAIAAVFLADGEIREQLTFQMLLRHADRGAGWLQQHFEPGERIALLFPPGLEVLEAFWACSRAGLIPVPLSPSLGRHRLASLAPILNSCSAAAALGPRILLQRQRNLLDRQSEAPRLQWLDWASLLAEAERLACRRQPASQGGVAFLQYTSGSTGHPKGVIVSHGNLRHNLQQIVTVCGTHSGSRCLSWMPHFHDMSLIGAILHSLVLGAPIMLMAPAEFLRNPLGWLQQISRHRITFAMAPESALQLCLQAAERGRHALDGLDLSGLEVLACGSEPIRRSVLDGFHRVFGPAGLRPDVLLCAYGLAEATLMVSGARHRHPPHPPHPPLLNQADRLSPSGRCIQGQRIRVVDPVSFAPLPDGREGLILVRGPSVSRGYWQAPEASSRVFDQVVEGEAGYLNTGDLGYCDGEDLVVTGRTKDLIIAGGRKIHAVDVEDFVHAITPLHSEAIVAIVRCVAFSSRGSADTAELAAEHLVLLLESDSRPAESEAQALLGAYAARVSQQFGAGVGAVWLLPAHALPITTSGKLRRSEARRLYEQALVRPLHRWPGSPPERSPAAVTLPLLKRALAGVLGLDPLLLEGDQKLSDLALGSLQLAELKVALDQQLQADLPLEPFLADLTLRQLSLQLQQSMAAEACPQRADLLDDSAALHALMVSGLPDHLRQLQQQHGDWLSVRWGHQVLHLLSDPQEVQSLMQRPDTEFIRGKVFEGIRMVTDEHNLFTSEGEAWQRERQRIQPHLSRGAVEAMAVDFAPISQRCLDRLLAGRGSMALDLAELCRTITLEITLCKLFGPLPAGVADQVTAALREETDWRLPLHYLAQAELRQVGQQRDDTGGAWATAESLLPALDALVYAAIDDGISRDALDRSPCLLAAYLADGPVQAMATAERRRYLRSVMLSLLLAGLDSTGSGLYFCLDLLARHPQVQQTLRQEVRQACGDGPIAPVDLPRQLPWTLAAVQESLRLYPPIWFLGREAVAATAVMGHPVNPGDLVLTSPYVIHRHPAHWPAPELFRPERFLRQPAAGPGSHLYLPFGVGPRTCVGRWLALYEISLAAAALVQGHQLRSDGEDCPELSSYFSLNTLRPIRLQVEPCG